MTDSQVTDTHVRSHVSVTDTQVTHTWLTLKSHTHDSHSSHTHMTHTQVTLRDTHTTHTSSHWHSSHKSCVSHYPRSPALRNDPGTVTIPQYRFNKKQSNTHWHSSHKSCVSHWHSRHTHMTDTQVTLRDTHTTHTHHSHAGPYKTNIWRCAVSLKHARWGLTTRSCCTLPLRR